MGDYISIIYYRRHEKQICNVVVPITITSPRRLYAIFYQLDMNKCLPVITVYQNFRESKMSASTSDFPGRSPSEEKSAANIPRRAHSSIIKEPQPIVHTNVHAQPQTPPTRRPVTCLNPCSKAAPTPMTMKNPPVKNSVPRPTPHIPASCINPETANAPMSAPGRPSSARPGCEPKATKS